MIEESNYLLLTLSFLVWIISSVRGIATYTYYWQLKEYRWDRMHEFLSSKRGKSAIFSIHNGFRIIILILLANYLWDAEASHLNLSIWFLLLVLGLLSFGRMLWDYKNHTLYRPKLTFKMYLIVLSTLLFEAFVWWIFRYEPITVLTLELLRPFTLTIILKVIGIPFFCLKRYVMHKATKKRKLYKELKVVGITGSYGKTSTKEFLAKILESKFDIAKTPKHVNVDIGVAQVMLNDITGEEDIFIVEMGAYKIGEIKSTCNIVKPQTGILTGINEQHICFFGNLENTIKAKAELLASLPKDGLAIVNADNYNVQKSLEYNNSERVIKYGLNNDREIKASNIIQKGRVLCFTVHAGHKRANFEVPLFGKHYVQNLLGCIACALDFGMTLDEIAEAAKSCEAPAGSLAIFDGKKGSTIVDDSYNSNPDGFDAALSSLKALKAKRVILVTPGMMELGVHSEQIHRRIGHEIAAKCDVIFISSEDNYHILKTAIQEKSSKKEIIYECDHQELIKKISKVLKKGDLILFENRVPQIVIEHFKK